MMDELFEKKLEQDLQKIEVDAPSRFRPASPTSRSLRARNW